MRFTYTESFPAVPPEEAEARMRLIRKIVAARLADEILRQIRTGQKKPESA